MPYRASTNSTCTFVPLAYSSQLLTVLGNGITSRMLDIPVRYITPVSYTHLDVYKRQVIWYLAAVLLLVWTLGSYQGFCVCYMALVLISFLGSYETDMHKGQEEAFLYGIRQVIIFIIGFILYFLTASFLCRIKGGDSSYEMCIRDSLPDLQYFQRISQIH